MGDAPRRLAGGQRRQLGPADTQQQGCHATARRALVASGRTRARGVQHENNRKLAYTTATAARPLAAFGDQSVTYERVRLHRQPYYGSVGTIHHIVNYQVRLRATCGSDVVQRSPLITAMIEGVSIFVSRASSTKAFHPLPNYGTASTSHTQNHREQLDGVRDNFMSTWPIRLETLGATTKALGFGSPALEKENSVAMLESRGRDFVPCSVQTYPRSVY
ncbi:hypothetical protein AURDEDRAFT_174616 [Auricularia subglabra TFB-10046 SS5]|uniref:Uncharacterized protein n=1 Tax=Auricularia subglabra (strain TFB-10046 / SS5) TaxID=717982 RepID=J0LFT6_AURST|nr:hypothetical protein AURDEDRAFT_174616 [Auricularia subglabra TFB-10046 SS5]